MIFYKVYIFLINLQNYYINKILTYISLTFTLFN